MIVVKSTEVLEVTGDICQIPVYPKKGHLFSFSDKEDAVAATYETETIRGQEYRLPDGRRGIIGLSRQVHEALRIPLQCVQDQGEHIERLSKECNDARRDLLDAKGELATMKKWGWFRRARFFITGA